MNTIELLRKNNIKVRVTHKRFYKLAVYDYSDNPYILLAQHELDANTVSLLPYEKGGETEVMITFPNGITTTGQAFCSLEDAYCRKEGVRIALSRALNLKE